MNDDSFIVFLFFSHFSLPIIEFSSFAQLILIKSRIYKQNHIYEKEYNIFQYFESKFDPVIYIPIAKIRAIKIKRKGI